jgi:hypothetical protein
MKDAIDWFPPAISENEKDNTVMALLGARTFGKTRITKVCPTYRPEWVFYVLAPIIMGMQYTLRGPI